MLHKQAVQKLLRIVVPDNIGGYVKLYISVYTIFFEGCLFVAFKCRFWMLNTGCYDFLQFNLFLLK